MIKINKRHKKVCHKKLKFQDYKNSLSEAQITIK